MADNNNKKTLIVDVFDAYYYDNEDNLVFYSENLTSAGINNEISQEEVKNGKGNKLFAVLNKDKSANITLSSNVFSPATLALNSGADIVLGSGKAYTPKTKYVLNSTKKITLAQEPIGTAPVFHIEKADGTIIDSAKYSYATSAITFTDDTLSEKDIVFVFPYAYETAETATTIVIGADTFPEGGKLVLTTYERNANQKIVADITIIAESVYPNGTWEFNTQSEITPVDISMDMKVLADSEGNYYKIVRTPR